MVTTGIEQLLNSCLSFFYVLYEAGVGLFTWATTPIEQTGDSFIDGIISTFIGMTPFEAFFGVAFVTIIFTWVVKFFMPMI